MVTVLEFSDSSRNFNTPTQSPWEWNAASGLTRAQQSARMRPKGKIFHHRERGGQTTEGTLQVGYMDAFGNVTGSPELNVFFSWIPPGKSREQISLEFQLDKKFYHQLRWCHGDGFLVLFFWGQTFKILFWSEISHWKVLHYLKRFSYTFHLIYFWWSLYLPFFFFLKAGLRKCKLPFKQKVVCKGTQLIYHSLTLSKTQHQFTT